MNINDYIRSNLNTFDQEPLNEVDSLILSELSYIHFDEDLVNRFLKIKLKDLYQLEVFKDYFKLLWDEENVEKMFGLLCASPRFRDIELSYFSHETIIENNQQFAAITYKLDKKHYYIAYRGTDCSFTAWKEDLLLSADDPVASQLLAVEYLNKILSKTRGQLYVGGHSKGGNLAVYASAMCINQDRIQTVYSHDGPGFNETELMSDGFKNIKSKIAKTLPQSSMVGLLMNQEASYKIIHSNAISINQHNPFTWMIENHQFTSDTSITWDASLVTGCLNMWQDQVPNNQKKVFIDTIFNIMYNSNAENFNDLGHNLNKSIPSIVNEYSKLDVDSKKLIKDTVGSLISTGTLQVPEMLKKAFN